MTTIQGFTILNFARIIVEIAFVVASSCGCTHTHPMMPRMTWNNSSFTIALDGTSSNDLVVAADSDVSNEDYHLFLMLFDSAKLFRWIIHRG